MRRLLAATFVVALITAGAGLPAAGDPPFPPPGQELAKFWVGAAKRSINPDADGTFAGKPVFLGGYGFGSGPIWQALGTDRPPASGILGPGINARAFVVAEAHPTKDRPANPADALVFVEIETQGYFTSYQQGPFGTEDIRKAAAEATGIPAPRIIVGGNHTHAGPDTLGVWGGVPVEYLQFVKDQTVGAVADAWAARQRSTLWFGTADATDLISNQFGYDPANQRVDTELRVLQARDADTGDPFATLMNLSAHPTVMGGDNTLVSADWPGPAAESLGAAVGGEGFVMMGSLGRSQPRDGASFDACRAQGLEGVAVDHCAVDDFAGRVVAVANQAVASAQSLKGARDVDGHSYLIVDVAHNALLLGLTTVGRAVGVPINRSFLPPWAAGNVIGTTTFTARIGDLIFSGGPGELYPQIHGVIRDTVPAAGHFVFGLAGDMLGYIIAPFPEAYPEPIRRSLFDGDPNDPTTWGFDPIGNDNYFFNVSHTLGERVICSMLRGVGDVTGNGLSYWQGRSQCLAFGDDAAIPPDADLLAPPPPVGLP